MAKVKEYKTASGATICFHNTAYENKTEAEKEKIREDINEQIARILTRSLGGTK